MDTYNKSQILADFVEGKYEQIFCDKCMNTFLTNVYKFDDTHVLLEKRSLGLEYFCDAIHEYDLSIFPKIVRIGILDDDDDVIPFASNTQMFDESETELRFIYVMEKMEHLGVDDAEVFNAYTKDLDWKNEEEREKAFAKISERYGANLEKEIEYLFEYYQEHKKYLLWDLHGDNLMRRIDNGEILILDPFALRV